MNAYQTVRTFLIALAAVVLIVLVIAPSTGWIARSQLARVFVPATDVWDLRRTPAPDLMSSDYRIALASTQGSPTEHTQQIRALEERFPEKASLYANAMRYATQENVHLYRDESSLFYGLKLQPRQVPPKQEALIAFDRDAATGERLDPNNGYFPAMRSIGLFAQHRDEDALAALHRAGQKTEWREYYEDDAEGSVRHREQAKGRQSAIARTAIFAAILFPHLGALRASARTATYLAMQAEVHGDPAHGAQIRRDVMQVGGLMRARGQSGSAVLVGVGIANTALLRPGGAPVPQSSNDEVPVNAVDDYCRYLQETHQSAIIPSVQAEYAAGKIASQMTSAEIHKNDNPFNAWETLVRRWMTGWILLANIAWMILFGGCAGLIVRLRVSLKAASGRGRLAIGAAALAGAVILGVATVAQSKQFLGSAEMISMLSDSSRDSQQLVRLNLPLSMLLILAAPIATFLTCAVIALIRRASFPTTLTQGFRRAALPIAAVGVFLYAACLITTSHLETGQNKALGRMLEGSGTYFAELPHEKWPGITAWPGN